MNEKLFNAVKEAFVPMFSECSIMSNAWATGSPFRIHLKPEPRKC